MNSSILVRPSSVATDQLIGFGVCLRFTARADRPSDAGMVDHGRDDHGGDRDV